MSWRNFKNAEVRLAASVFLVGPNASGKSNLLDALRFLRDLAPDGGLAAAVQRRHGVSALRCLHATRNSDVGIEVDVGDDDCPDRWTYEVRFNLKKGEQPVLKRERVARLGRTLVDRLSGQDRDDAALLWAPDGAPRRGHEVGLG